MTATTVPQVSEGRRLCAQTTEVDLPGHPADLLEHLGADGVAWFADDVSFVTAGIAATVAPADAAAVLATIERDGDGPHAAAAPLAAGALPFDGGGLLAVPATTVGLTAGGRAWTTTIGPAGGATPRAMTMAPSRAPSRFTVEARPDARGWEQQVVAALALIEAGAIQKVVLAREVEVAADHPFDRADVLALLLRHNRPGCIVYAHRGFVGATPELLVTRHGSDVTSTPMAGSIPLGLEADDDAVRALLTSAKQGVEHALLVRAVGETLAPFCTDVNVGSPEAVRLATVTHLATTVTATLREAGTTALDLALALHPTPAVGGTPRAGALDAIRRLESFDRGLYGGPVGWVSAGGDGEFAVALRCALIDGARARLFAGAGIVAGSDPDAEWAETQAKLEPMLRALIRP
ncbi:MAG: isochorismate synthase [Acidimicrobiia bacterium]|nr:isochorismate synthase [Acidimicrobiia bacterium]